MVVSGFKEDGGMSSTATIDPGGQTSSPLRDRLLVAWSAAGAILPCLLPNTGPAILGLSVAAPLILADPVSLNRNLRQVSPVLAFTIACVLYLCVNLLLAPMIDNAVGAVVTIALAAGACHLCAAAFPILRIRDLKLMALGLFMGCLLMAGFLFFEYMTRMSLLRGLQRLTEKAKLPFIRVEAGTWEAPFYPYMSRNLVVLIMLSWAAVAFAWATCGRNIRRIVVPAFLLLVLASAMLSPSATAKVGFIAGAAAFVGNDSGLGHIAAAVGVPTVTVFGPGEPDRYRPWGPHARIVMAPDLNLQKLDAVPVLDALRAALASRSTT